MATYQVEVIYQGQSQTFTADSEQSILDSAQAAGVELPASCLTGVCTTCAARILSGEVDQPDAMGVGPEPAKQGYALLCVAYPRSDLKIETHKEDELYALQFGQPG